MQIWTDAVQHNISIALGDIQSAEAFENGMRAQIENDSGIKTCWEQFIPGLRLWGFDAFVDGVLSADSP